MKTLTDRKLAEEQKVTFETQRMAQETRQTLEKETALAEMQKEIVLAQQGVQIAERTAESAVKKANGEASSIKLQANAEAERLRMMGNAEAERTRATGDAEAAKILAIGKSNAEAYQLQVQSLGSDSFVRMKIAEIIGKEGVKIIPDTLIVGNGGEGNSGGGIVDLLGLKLLENWKGENSGQPAPLGMAAGNGKIVPKTRE